MTEHALGPVSEDTFCGKQLQNILVIMAFYVLSIMQPRHYCTVSIVGIPKRVTVLERPWYSTSSMHVIVAC